MHGIVLILLLLLCGDVACTEIIVDLDIMTNKPRLLLVEDGTIVRTYPITAPKHTPSCLYNADAYGVVETIDPHAIWRPTTKTRLAMARKGTPLREYYGPNSTHNALGGRKLVIMWEGQCIEHTVRIHGTIKPHLVTQQARASRGCIRMLNGDWDDLAHLIEPGTLVRMTVQY